MRFEQGVFVISIHSIRAVVAGHSVGLFAPRAVVLVLSATVDVPGCAGCPL